MKRSSNHVFCDTCGLKVPLPHSDGGRDTGRCDRCMKVIWRTSPAGHHAACSLAVCGAILTVPTIFLPLVTLSKFGNQKVTYFLPQLETLFAHDFGFLAAILLLLAVGLPVILLLLILVQELQVELPIISRFREPMTMIIHLVEPWTMPEVYVLGVIIAYFKLGDFVRFDLGPAFWSYCAMSMFMLAAWRQFSLLPTNVRQREKALLPASGQSMVWAPLVAAVILLFPAYLLPVMSTSSIGEAATDRTILNGIMSLGRSGHWPLAVIVFVASIVVPVIKISCLAWLALQRESKTRDQAIFKTRLYELIEFVGRWSMLDVFLVAFLAGSVQFGQLARVEPRQGIIAFAGVVILTMAATAAFDPRSLWEDDIGKTKEGLT